MHAHTHTCHQNKCGPTCQLQIKGRQNSRGRRQPTAVSSVQNIYESGIQIINQHKWFEMIQTETTVNSCAEILYIKPCKC